MPSLAKGMMFRALRIFAVLFALTAMLSVSAASLSAAHSHHRLEPADQCSVCCTAHMTASEIAVIHVVYAPELRSFESPLITVRDAESRTITSSLTRGPPALS
jgi:hypothetical protein